MTFSLGVSAQVKTYLTVAPLPAGTIASSTKAEILVFVYLTDGSVLTQSKTVSLTNAGGTFDVAVQNLYSSDIPYICETQYILKVNSLLVQSSNYYDNFMQYARCSLGEDDITFVIWH